MTLKRSNKQYLDVESFEEYEFRAKVLIKTIDGEHHLDVYTTDDNKESVEDVLLDRKTDKVTSLQIMYWTTRANDDASAEMIEEWLNEN